MSDIDEVLSDMIAYENDELDLDQTIAFFQRIIDSGLVWSLQGHYGRTAVSLITAGHCKPVEDTPFTVVRVP